MLFSSSLVALGFSVLVTPTAALTSSLAITSIPNVVNISNTNVTASYSGFNFTRSRGSPVTVLPTDPPVTVGTDVVSLGTGGVLVIDSSTTSLIENATTRSHSFTSTTLSTNKTTQITSSSSASRSTNTISQSESSTSSSLSRNTTISTSSSSSLINSTATQKSSTSLSSRSTNSITSSSLVSSSRNTTIPKTSSSITSSQTGNITTTTASSTSSTSLTSQNQTSQSGSSSSTASTSSVTSKSSSSSQTSPITTSKSQTGTSSVSSQSSSNTPTLTTYSAYPSGFSAIKITTGETTDGHTTSTDSSGHHTVIPIIGGPKCWFCPHGGSSGGIELPSLPFPGVFPPPPGPPGFSISVDAPSITIDSNGDPTYSSEPTSTPSNTATSTGKSSSSGSSSSSSSSCTKSITASFCTTSLIYKANTASVTSTSTTTKCSTTTACSATDQTTTVKTTTTSTGTACSRIPVPTGLLTQPDDDEGTDDGSGDSGADSNDDSNSQKRSVIVNGYRSFTPRSHDNVLEKRGKPKSWLGPAQCGWGSVVEPYVPKKLNNIKGPSYPNAEELTNFAPGAKPGGNAYMWVVTKPGAGADTCDGIPWDVTTVGNDKVLSSQDAQGYTYQWDAGQEDGKAYVNADHVFELKILKDFFTDDAPDYSTDKAGCDNWRKFWVYETNAETSEYTDQFGKNFFNGGDVWTRMQTLFKLLPGSANPTWADFVGMDKNVNKVKGNLLQRGLGDVKNDADKPHPEDWIQTLNLIGVAQKVLHMDEVASRFKTTNARLYGAMQQIQGISGGCGPPTPNYASKYSAWMENHLKTQGQQVTDAYNSIITTKLPASVLTSTLTDEHGTSTGEDTHLADLLAAVTKSFPVESLTYDTGALFTWPAAPAASQGITIKKRDDSTAVPAACAPASATASQTSSSTSASSTSASKSSTSSTPPSTSSSTTPPPTTKPTSTSTSVTGFTVTLSAGGTSPSVACDGSASSCAHVACSLPGETAACFTNDQTGAKTCQCQEAIS